MIRARGGVTAAAAFVVAVTGQLHTLLSVSFTRFDNGTGGVVAAVHERASPHQPSANVNNV